MHIKHKWSKWAVTQAKVLRGGKMVNVTIQYRICEKCGYTHKQFV